MNCIVIGQGRAGRARVRTIHDHPTCTLIRHVAGRDFEITESKEKMLYFVCTENREHYRTCVLLLKRGHDVAVEFPPCTTQHEWRELRSLAQKNGCFLHCGLIGLYTEQHRFRKEWLQNHTARQVTVSFSGGLYRWVKEEAEGGYLPQLSFGRVAALWDLFGPLRIDNVQAKSESHQYRFTLSARGKNGEDILLQEHRKENGSRRTVWNMMGDNEVFVPPETSTKDLFGVDLDRILNRVPCDVSLEDIFGFLDKASGFLRKGMA